MGVRGSPVTGPVRLGLAFVMVLTACGDAGSSEVTTTTGPSTTVSSTSTTTSIAPTTTTTQPPDTTTTVPVSVDIAADDAPPLEVLFSLPADGVAITYQGGGPEMPISGPQGFSVALDGSIWIADTEALRIIRVDEDGALLVDIDTDADLVGPIIDVAAHDAGVYALEAVPALRRYRIIAYSPDGEFLAEYPLPERLHLENGLTGISASRDGQVWIEIEGGRRVFAAFDADRLFQPTEVDGHLAGTTLVEWAQPGGNRAGVVVGGQRIDFAVRDTGAVRFRGAAPGVIGLMIEDVAFADVVLVDVRCVVVDEHGGVLAEGVYPLDEVDDVYVPQDFTALAPDGRFIALVPRADRIDVVALALYAPGHLSMDD